MSLFVVNVLFFLQANHNKKEELHTLVALFLTKNSCICYNILATTLQYAICNILHVEVRLGRI